MPIIQSLAGQKFGRLTAIDISHRVKNRTYWNCTCKCGKTTKVTIHKLRSGWTTSCGCYLKERQREGQLTHGMSSTSESYAYTNMVNRCTKPNDSHYHRYGGRGIKICDRWLGENGRLNFHSDMGKKPTKTHSLERKDNNGPYSPDNCIWADKMTQGQNTSRNRNFTHNGKTQCMSAWNRELGLSCTGILTRLKHGWTIERILSTPNLKVVQRRQLEAISASEIQNSVIADPVDYRAD